MLNRKPSKRGRPRKQSDDQGSGEEFQHKARKRTTSKKVLDEKKKSKITTKPPKSKVQLVSSIESFSESDMDDEKHRKHVKVPIEVFNADLVFAQILNKANKEPEFLINLKNLLSGYSRIQEDKKSQYRKKWKLLRNSNCTQDQYLSRQSELKRMEAQEFNQFQEDIISKLCISQIKGFQTKDSILQKAKHAKGFIDQGVDYVIDEKSWNAYRVEQKKLLQILMKENDFVSQDYKLVNMTMNYTAPQPTNSIKQQQNQMEMKFNNIETEQNPQHTQFLFCKHYNNVNYDKVFDSSNPFRVAEQDKYYIDSKALAWLLQSKCDEIYTNEQFQKQTYNQYSKILKDLYNKPHEASDKQVMDDLLEVGAYVLNSVHYYQKFKLKCDLLHPLDLMLVIEKLAKERSISLSGSKMDEQPRRANPKHEMIDEKDQINY